MAGRRFEDLDLLTLRAIARHSPPTSALYRAMEPEWRITDETFLLRDIEHSLRVLRWMKTEDAQRQVNYPQPIPLTEVERRAVKPERYDPLPVGDMLAWLGWSQPNPN